MLNQKDSVCKMCFTVKQHALLVLPQSLMVKKKIKFVQTTLKEREIWWGGRVGPGLGRD